MKKLLIALICLTTNASLSQTNHVHNVSHLQENSVDPAYDGRAGSLTGYVRDIACLLRNPKASAATTPETKSCLRKRIASGSPIGILASDGTLFTPISNAIPDASVRKGLLPYVGKYVQADGRLFERGNLHAISISHIRIVEPPKMQ